MNWDWDKLQEKRQKQGSNPPPRQPQDFETDDTEQEDEAPRARRTPFNNGRGSGNGGGGGGENPFAKIARMRFPNGRAIFVVIFAIVGLWLLSGIYIINPDERALCCVLASMTAPRAPAPTMRGPRLSNQYTSRR